MLTPEQLAEIQKRVDAATPEPWVVETVGDEHEYISGHITAEAHNYAGNKVSRRDSVCAPDSLTSDDATFIAAARTDIPALLAHIKELEKVVEAARLVDRSYREPIRASMAMVGGSELIDLRTRLEALDRAGE